MFSVLPAASFSSFTKSICLCLQWQYDINHIFLKINVSIKKRRKVKSAEQKTRSILKTLTLQLSAFRYALTALL
jgi:hypothetical protein